MGTPWPAGATATWDFGDGSAPVTAPAGGFVDHAFPTAGTFVLTVTGYDAGGTAIAQLSRTLYVSRTDAPYAAMAPVINASVPGLTLHGRALPVTCVALVAPDNARGADYVSCTVVARVDPAVQARLGLASDVVGSGTTTGGAGQRPSAKVNVIITPEATAKLVALHESVTLQLEATVVSPTGLVSDPTTMSAELRGMAGYNDCPPITAGLVCFPWMGRQAADGAAGEVTGAGWPGITGLRRQITADDSTGAQLDGTYLNDALLGRHGNDKLVGGEGDDVLWADAAPKVRATAQSDRSEAGAGNDWIYASAGTNKVFGGDGDDRIFAVEGAGTIDCGAGLDTVTLKKQKKLKRTKKQIKAHRKPKLTPDTYRLKGCERITRR